LTLDSGLPTQDIKS